MLNIVYIGFEKIFSYLEQGSCHIYIRIYIYEKLTEVYIFSDHRLYMFWSYLSLGLLFGNLGSRYVSNFVT